jgi:hypothetical protein
MSAPWEEVSPNHRRCGFCSKVLLSRFGCWQHMQAKHTPVPKVENFAPVGRQPKQDAEPSYASLVVAAQIDAAMGLPVDADLADVIDIYGVHCR